MTKKELEEQVKELQANLELAKRTEMKALYELGRWRKKANDLLEEKKELEDRVSVMEDGLKEISQLVDCIIAQWAMACGKEKDGVYRLEIPIEDLMLNRSYDVRTEAIEDMYVVRVKKKGEA